MVAVDLRAAIAEQADGRSQIGRYLLNTSGLAPGMLYSLWV